MKRWQGGEAIKEASRRRACLLPLDFPSWPGVTPEGLPFSGVCRPRGPLAAQKCRCNENSCGEGVTRLDNNLPLGMLLLCPVRLAPELSLLCPPWAMSIRLRAQCQEGAKMLASTVGSAKGQGSSRETFRSARLLPKLVSTRLYPQSAPPRRPGFQPCSPRLENRCHLTLTDLSLASSVVRPEDNDVKQSPTGPFGKRPLELPAVSPGPPARAKSVNQHKSPDSLWRGFEQVLLMGLSLALCSVLDSWVVVKKA